MCELEALPSFWRIRRCKETSHTVAFLHRSNCGFLTSVQSWTCICWGRTSSSDLKHTLQAGTNSGLSMEAWTSAIPSHPPNTHLRWTYRSEWIALVRLPFHRLCHLWWKSSEGRSWLRNSTSDFLLQECWCNRIWPCHDSDLKAISLCSLCSRYGRTVVVIA